MLLDITFPFQYAMALFSIKSKIQQPNIFMFTVIQKVYQVGYNKNIFFLVRYSLHVIYFRCRQYIFFQQYTESASGDYNDLDSQTEYFLKLE